MSAVEATREAPPTPAPRAVRRPVRTVLRAVRPHQWPKNALVVAAPVAAGSWGPRGHGWVYCLVAGLAFVAASSAVYLVNDVVDVERDRLHPRKRLRPVAAGHLSETSALVAAAVCVVAMLAAAALVDQSWFSASLTLYLVLSIFYSLGLKQVPVLELVVVSSGFVLRALGGAAATRIAPSVPFLVVVALGALVVVLEKRASECADLRGDAAEHRPVLASYDVATLRRAATVLSGVVLLAYLAWTLTQHAVLVPHLHVVTVVPLAAAFVVFHRRMVADPRRRVEDVLTRDPLVLLCELSWLVVFAVSAWP